MKCFLITSLLLICPTLVFAQVSTETIVDNGDGTTSRVVTTTFPINPQEQQSRCDEIQQRADDCYAVIENAPQTFKDQAAAIEANAGTIQKGKI